MNLTDIINRKFSIPDYTFGKTRIPFSKTEFTIEELDYNLYSLRFYHGIGFVTRLQVIRFEITDNKIEIYTCGFFNLDQDCYTIVKNDCGELEMIMPKQWCSPNCKLIPIR